MKAPLAVVLLLGGLVSGSLASAEAGVNLSWDACTSEGGIQNKTFSCNTNSGSRVLYGSFVLAADQPNFVGVEVKVDITAQADSLPAWWRFAGPNTCRAALSANFSFWSDPGISCIDPWNGQGTGNIANYFTSWTPGAGMSPNTAQVLIGGAVPSDSPISLTAGTEYYCFKLVLTSTKTVGSGACAGCSTPVCIVLSQIKAVQSDGSQETLTDPITSNVVTWQSATGCANGPKSTWGQIRALMH